MSISKQIRKIFIDYEVTLKHLPGGHNQKRHGWRYGGTGAARRSMRNMREGGKYSDILSPKTTPEAERAAYRKRAGMPEPTKIPKVDPKEIYALSPEERYLRDLIGKRTPVYHDVGSAQDSHNEFYGLSSWKKWKKSLSEDEIWAIKEYTSYNYAGTGIPFNTRPFTRLNTALRKKQFNEDEHPHSDLTKIAKNLDGLMKRSSLHRDMMLFRAFGSDNFYSKAGDGSIKRGSVIEDLGYVSSSPARSTADMFHADAMPVWGKKPVYMNIKAPKGTKGIYVTHSDFNKYTSQAEFILPRGTKFVVEDVRYEYMNGYQTAIYDVIAVTE